MFKDFQIEYVVSMSVAAAIIYGMNPLVKQLIQDYKKNDDIYSSKLRDTILRAGSQSAVTAASIYLILLTIDLLDVDSLLYPSMDGNLRRGAFRVALSVWSALSFCIIKRALFLQAVSGNRLGRVALYDRFLDFLVGIVTIATTFDAFDVDIGVGMQSIMAGSGVGALAFSLASKDLASNIVGGLVIQSWDAFTLGDIICLGDGTEGTVVKIGLVETEVLGYDNVTVMIPNSHFSGVRVSNMTVVKTARVLVELRFHYSDMEKLPNVLDDIKDEIKKSCPKLISDGSKPFFACLTGFNADHVEATVNTHYDMPFRSLEYVDNRHEVLLAISRAVKRNKVEFALPSINYATQTKSS